MPIEDTTRIFFSFSVYLAHFHCILSQNRYCDCRGYGHRNNCENIVETNQRRTIESCCFFLSSSRKYLYLLKIKVSRYLVVSFTPYLARFIYMKIYLTTTFYEMLDRGDFMHYTNSRNLRARNNSRSSTLHRQRVYYTVCGLSRVTKKEGTQM